MARMVRKQKKQKLSKRKKASSSSVTSQEDGLQDAPVKQVESETDAAEDIAITSKKQVFKIRCNICGETRIAAVPETHMGFGGIKCRNCNTFDNFFGEYTNNGVNYSWVTLPTVDEMGYSGKVPYLLRCSHAGEIVEFFQQNKCSSFVINNIFTELGIHVSPSAVSYSAIATEKQIEEQKSLVAKLARQLKKIIK